MVSVQEQLNTSSEETRRYPNWIDMVHPFMHKNGYEWDVQKAAAFKLEKEAAQW